MKTIDKDKSFCVATIRNIQAESNWEAEAKTKSFPWQIANFNGAGIENGITAAAVLTTNLNGKLNKGFEVLAVTLSVFPILATLYLLLC